ncbi:hypothetical protein HY967_00975, partial [Candidatus Jorgensenbacteria bacterium]|nr:hypothetical protein [Candidatus Jorgensenbacteria bacterium]
SGKRLEPVHASSAGQYADNYPTYNDFNTDEFIQPDGTFGSSDPYIFWFDPQSRYHQLGTAGGLTYLLTDYPIDLKDPMDEITGMYNLQKAAWEWQQKQEEMLRQHEVSSK